MTYVTARSQRRRRKPNGFRHPRAGEKVTDGHGGTYPVIASGDGRLLLQDVDGLCFVLHTHRLKSGSWRAIR